MSLIRIIAPERKFAANASAIKLFAHAQSPHKPPENLPLWDEDQIESAPDILSAGDRSSAQDAETEGMVERIWNAVGRKAGTISTVKA
jgi:hypothetical protein